MRSKHIYQKRNSHLKVRQEKKRMNLTSQKKASEHSHNGDSVFLLLICLEDFVIAALETKLLLAQNVIASAILDQISYNNERLILFHLILQEM
jgi:hypothetical protein